MPLLKKYWLFFVYLIFTGILFAIAVPPFQKPDENRHYYQASMLSRGIFSCSSLKLPSSVVEFPNILKFDEIAHTPPYKFAPQLFQLYKYPTNDPVTDQTGWCSYSFVGYIPNSLGLLLGRATGSRMIEFYVSRLFALTLFLLAVIFSLKIAAKPARPWILLYAGLPMTLHQVTSITYDILPLILAPLVFAYFTQFISAKNNPSKTATAIYLISLVLIVLSKPVYAPLLLLAFFTRRLWVTVGLILASGVVLGLVLVPYLTTTPAYTSIGSGVNAILQQQVVFQDPLWLAKAIYKTISLDGQALYEGFIGNFGWLDYKPNYYLFLAFPLIFTWLTLKGAGKIQLNRPQLGTLLTIVLSITLLVFTSLYIIWTPVGADYVTGVQGRYFVIMLPFIGLLISHLVHLIRSSPKLRTLTSFILLTIVLIHLSSLVYTRYYDYSKSGYNDPVVIGKVTNTLGIEKIKELPLDLPADQQKLAGFYFYANIGTARPGQYRYQVLEDGCQKILKEGYLQSIYVAGLDGLHLEKFNPFWVKSRRLCLRLIPIGQPPLILQEIAGSYLKPLYLITSLR